MEIFDEYNNLNINEYECQNKDELKKYIKVCTDDINIELDDIKKAIIYNYIDEQKDRIVELFTFEYNSNIIYYSEERQLFKELLKFCKKYLQYYKLILKNIDNNSLQNMYKLSVMTSKYFRSNLEYLDYQVKRHRSLFSGITYSDTNKKDRIEEFDNLFNSVIYNKDKVKCYER